jgi:hypothetical protein
VVGYGTFSLCVIHKEGLRPGCGDINRLMMMRSQGILGESILKRCVISFKILLALRYETY